MDVNSDRKFLRQFSGVIAGFMVLTQSAFKLNSDMGLLTAITIALALIADFIFLPPLLMKVDKK